MRLTADLLKQLPTKINISGKGWSRLELSLATVRLCPVSNILDLYKITWSTGTYGSNKACALPATRAPLPTALTALI